jgi:hypothetical protein
MRRVVTALQAVCVDVPVGFGARSAKDGESKLRVAVSGWLVSCSHGATFIAGGLPQ